MLLQAKPQRANDQDLLGVLSVNRIIAKLTSTSKLTALGPQLSRLATSNALLRHFAAQVLVGKRVTMKNLRFTGPFICSGCNSMYALSFALCRNCAVLVAGLPLLLRLIEMKLASGLRSIRRTHRDFADVVELIAIRKLDGSFARLLHKSLRPTFRELVHRVTHS